LIVAFSLPHCDLGDAWSAGYICPLLVLAVSEWSLSHDTECRPMCALARPHTYWNWTAWPQSCWLTGKPVSSQR